MANIANITVKKSDGTTDITYNALVGSAGDKQPALWSVTAASGKASHRPQARMVSQSNQAKTVRRVEITTVLPVVQSVNGVDTITDNVPAVTTFMLPVGVDDTVKAELVAQHSNLLANASVRAQILTGFSFT